MCKELLCVKRGEKADFMYILGHPSLRPSLTAEHKAAFGLLFNAAGYDQPPASLKAMGLPLQTLQEFRFPLPTLLQLGFANDLLAQRHDPKTLFLTAALGKIDVTVSLTTRRRTQA
jgi:hypothetical protein